MATPPSPTTRSVPTGWKMPDGFKSLVTLGRLAGINLWEKQVKPPTVDGGDLIDITTMLNNEVRTFAPKKLKKIGPEWTFMCAYDPDTIVDIMSLVLAPDTVTLRLPDTSTWAFYAVLLKFEPGELKEGEFPEATVTIGITNVDPSDGSEQKPVFTAATGT